MPSADCWLVGARGPESRIGSGLVGQQGKWLKQGKSDKQVGEANGIESVNVLVLGCLAWPSQSFAVVGYVPDYRFGDIDWSKVVARTSHVVLFSLTPTEQGLEGTPIIRNLLHPQSPLSQALERQGAEAPKVLVSIGGAGRSQGFSAAVSSKKGRKRMVKLILDLLNEVPQLAGVDFDWQVPTTPAEWQNLGKLAQILRTSSKGGQAPVITMTFHAMSGAIRTIAGLRSQTSDMSFVDLFDMCHAMTYTMMDGLGRHATDKVDRDTIQAWSKSGLPAAKLTLGIPFFGVKAGSDPRTFAELVAKEPKLLQDPTIDVSEDGYFFANGYSLAEKVSLAEKEGLAPWSASIVLLQG
ncbi:chiB1 [Symbiodinium natans]|uniref:ChiB1 protein n=1 Tax=Symbiodinium natans TaxID=878477 RepID=A0A812SYE5_9DINO|nr:chiB1 [Symbiodinium natans]